MHAIGSRHRAARAPSPSDQGNSTARGVHAIGSRHRAARAPAARGAPPRGETKAGAERPGELHREGRARYREPSPSGQVTQKEEGQHTWAVTERQEQNQPACLLTTHRSRSQCRIGGVSGEGERQRAKDSKPPTGSVWLCEIQTGRLLDFECVFNITPT